MFANSGRLRSKHAVTFGTMSIGLPLQRSTGPRLRIVLRSFGSRTSLLLRFKTRMDPNLTGLTSAAKATAADRGTGRLLQLKAVRSVFTKEASKGGETQCSWHRITLSQGTTISMSTVPLSGESTISATDTRGARPLNWTVRFSCWAEFRCIARPAM